jgi:hypothetical protein
MSAPSLRQELLTRISELPEHRLREALDFVSSLLLEDQRPLDERREHDQKLDPSKDSLLGFVGKISHGSLAQEIDGELYGRKSLRGLWKDLDFDITAEEIDQARREAWTNLPREDM